MSLESATEYLRRLATDSGFVAVLKATKGAEERRAVIAAGGYDFTLEELAEARALEQGDEESREQAISDGELAEVFGGSGQDLPHDWCWKSICPDAPCTKACVHNACPSDFLPQ